MFRLHLNVPSKWPRGQSLKKKDICQYYLFYLHFLKLLTSSKVITRSSDLPFVKLTSYVNISDMVVLFYGILGDNMSEYLLGVAMISYAVSNIVDGWIYIFLQPRVSRLVKRNFLACIPAGIRDGRTTNEPSEVYAVSRNGIDNLPTSVITTSSFTYKL